MHKHIGLSLIAVSLLALSACDTAQEQLGLTKQVPDEFKVIKRAPLEVPPHYTLRPPAPGAARPQEIEPTEQARQTVFGANDPSEPRRAPTSTEESLLRQAGANNIDPSIRSKVDSETANLKDENQPVIDKIISLGRDEGPSATVLDASKEAERLQKNQAEGKSVTDGESPSLGN